MTISPYQVDSILKAYNKQSKLRPLQSTASQEPVKSDKYADVVSLSSEGDKKAEAFDKISYSLMDVIIKGGK